MAEVLLLKLPCVLQVEPLLLKVSTTEFIDACSQETAQDCSHTDPDKLTVVCYILLFLGVGVYNNR